MSSDGSTVFFGALPLQFKFSASEKRELNRFARKLAAQLSPGKYFECLIADDRELQRLNHAFLKHNYPTDVLSFPTAGPAPALGECAISVERADEQSRQFGHSLMDELKILMLHGFLHLIGFDHEKDAGEMALAERKWRTEFKLPHSLIERSQSLQTASV
jgi:probable rRNA maturation factor